MLEEDRPDVQLGQLRLLGLGLGLGTRVRSRSRSRSREATSAADDAEQTATTTQAATPSSGTTHVVSSGETLNGIAARYDVAGGASSIAERNRIADPDRIATGQQLTLS